MSRFTARQFEGQILRQRRDAFTEGVRLVDEMLPRLRAQIDGATVQ